MVKKSLTRDGDSCASADVVYDGINWVVVVTTSNVTIKNIFGICSISMVTLHPVFFPSVLEMDG